MSEDIEKETSLPSPKNKRDHSNSIPSRIYDGLQTFWNGKHYLVLVDSYSGRFEIDQLRDMASTSVISKLKQPFSVHGNPHLLLSDNRTQYTSQQFKDFASTWDFVLVTSSPEFPQANGLAQKAVSSAKEFLEKFKCDHRETSS